MYRMHCDALQATLALKMDWMTDELQGYLNHTGQTLLAYSEQACYAVLSTSTATDELIGIGKTTFGKLLAAMSHLSVTVVGEPEFGTMCILIRHSTLTLKRRGNMAWSTSCRACRPEGCCTPSTLLPRFGEGISLRSG